WKNGCDDAKQALEVTTRSEEAMRQDRQGMLSDKEALDKLISDRAGAVGVKWSDLANIKDTDNVEEKVRKVRAALEGLRGDLAAREAELAKANKDLADAKALAFKYEAIAKASATEGARRQADVEKMRGTLVAEVQKNLDLVKQAAKDRDEANAATIQLKAVKDRNARLEGEMQELAKDLARVKANLGASSP